MPLAAVLWNGGISFGGVVSFIFAHLIIRTPDMVELGRREEALTATSQAVEHYRALAAANPAAFTPDLALSLIDLGTRLSELGRREEARAISQEGAKLSAHQ